MGKIFKGALLGAVSALGAYYYKNPKELEKHKDLLKENTKNGIEKLTAIINEKTQELGSKVQEEQDVAKEKLEELTSSEKLEENIEDIYLLDIPNSKEYIEKLVNLKPKKIYLICEEKQVLSDVYLIDKDRLIKLFNIILSIPNKQINITQQLDKLLTTLKTNVDSLKIMIQIFRELNLITFENNTIKLNENYKKVDLKQSASFVRMESIFEVEKLLLKENITNINKAFDKN